MKNVPTFIYNKTDFQEFEIIIEWIGSIILVILFPSLLRLKTRVYFYFF